MLGFLCVCYFSKDFYEADSENHSEETLFCFLLLQQSGNLNLWEGNIQIKVHVNCSLKEVKGFKRWQGFWMAEELDLFH